MNYSVILYTTTDCIECSMVKNMLQQLHIPYETRDVSIEPKYQAEIEQYGFMGVPVTVVDRVAIKGYRPDEIQRLIANHNR